MRGMGLELWACYCHSQGRQTLLRIYIDRQNDEGVTLDDCTRASREIGAILDVEDLIKQRYQLEVSSPGFDRVLLTLAHFARYIGSQVKVRLRAPTTNRRQFIARIDKVDDQHVFFVIDDETIQLTLSEIQKAHLVV